MSKKAEKLTLPSLLSFERKLEISDALMYSGHWEDKDKSNIFNEKKNDKETKKIAYWKPVEIKTRKNRGTISSHGASEQDMLKPNPKFSDNDGANLFMTDNTLKIAFSMRVIGNLGLPFACNQPYFEKCIVEKLNEIKEKTAVIDTLALRYAYNIANGRFLWRNRVGSEKIAIRVETNVGESKQFLNFEAYDFSLKDFDKNSNNEDLQKLTQIIRDGLLAEGDDQFTFIKVQAFVKLINGQQVFPSEEMNMGEDRKTLCNREGGAAVHDVKIGNAIKTIDTWYGSTVLVATPDKKVEKISIEGEIKKPIAIEPFGSVTQRGSAYRSEKTDLYTLMINWVNEKEDTEDKKRLSDEDKGYVIANLIRGGVFSRTKSAK